MSCPRPLAGLAAHGSTVGGAPILKINDETKIPQLPSSDMPSTPREPTTTCSVRIALSTDRSPSGSFTMREDVKCARRAAKNVGVVLSSDTWWCMATGNGPTRWVSRTGSARSGPGVWRGLADVLGGERKPAQRDLADERFGPGGDEVHAILREGLTWRGGDGALRPPHACPRLAPVDVLVGRTV